jgi:hypothetical protein
MVLCPLLLNLSIQIPIAKAEFISTSQYLAESGEISLRAQLLSFLDQEEITRELIAHGVSPLEARACFL